MIKKIIIALVLVIIVFVVYVKINGDKKILNENNVQVPAENQPNIITKEFSMTSFVEMVDGKPKPQYSLKEIVVNKGDTVKIKIKVTSGMHDFNIDEYNISAATPLNEEIEVEFVADKAGEFVYYCSMPGHRQNGHWGTLKVLE